MTTPLSQSNPARALASESGYTLTLRDGEHWSEVSLLRPDVIGDWPMAQMQATFAPAFAIEGSAGRTLTLRGLPVLDGLGAQMTGGSLIIHGQVGDDLGAGMTGGQIVVHGRAGDRIGGPWLTGDVSRQGMQGGRIIIHGDAGSYAGLRMRRGLIVITGQADLSPGYRMIDGTLVVGQGDLREPGLEMQRGTIFSLDREASVHTRGSFNAGHVLDANALTMITLRLKQLASLGVPVVEAMRQGSWRHWAGDSLTTGSGEIWQWA